MPDSSPNRSASPQSPPASEPDPQPHPLIEGEDFYREGPYVVFTEAYHLRRGSCCGSDCRHCPWRGERSA